MPYTRREAIAMGACCLTTALTGCQLPFGSGDEGKIDLHVVNQTPEPHHIRVNLIRPDTNEFSKVYSPSNGYIDVPGGNVDTEENERIVIKRDIADRRPYIVRARLDDATDPSLDDTWHHRHYFPDDTRNAVIVLYIGPPGGGNDVFVEIDVP